MSGFIFNPPLRLTPSVTVQTLNEASAYVQGCVQTQRPFIQAGVLRMLQSAYTPDQQRSAGKGFHLWAATEAFLLY
jgi:hypothetical protein